MTEAKGRDRKPRWAFLLRPGWLALFVVVIAFAYLCFTVLAPWQLGKNTKTSRENAQISRSLKAEPVPLTSVLPQQDSSAPDEQWQRVTATGHYLPDRQVLARLRVIEGEPAFEVLVPFAVDGGPTVLVDRGYVKPEQGSRVPPIAPAPGGTVTIVARLRDSEPSPEGKAPFRQDGAQQVYAINTPQISALLDVPLTGAYLQLIDGSAWRPRRNRPAAPGRGTLPVLRHSVDRVRHPRTARVGLLHRFGDPGASAREGRRRESARQRAAHHRGETRRSLRQATLTAAVASTALTS